MTVDQEKTRPAIATMPLLCRIRGLAVMSAAAVLAGGPAHAPDFFDYYAQAQPGIARAVDAVGGAERIEGIRHVH